MREVQGSEQEQVQGVKMAPGATVVLSACNTGRGEIKAEGVVGIARDFLLVNASAAVVSLWSVADRSTTALKRINYKHLAEGRTVPQALRLAMLRLARPRHAPLAVKYACENGLYLTCACVHLRAHARTPPHTQKTGENASCGRGFVGADDGRSGKRI
jgi:CHAT domain-containing protein